MQLVRPGSTGRGLAAGAIAAIVLLTACPAARAQGTPVISTYVGATGGDWNIPLLWAHLPPPPLGPVGTVPDNLGGYSYFVVIPDGHLNQSLSATVTELTVSNLAELRVQAGHLTVQTLTLNAGQLEVNAAGSYTSSIFENGGTLNVNSAGIVNALTLINGNIETGDISSESGVIELGTGVLNVGEVENRSQGVIHAMAGVSGFNVGLLRNAGEVLIDGPAAGLLIGSGIEITGDGELVMADELATLTATSTLQHTGNHTIRGYGTIDAATFGNDALVSADQAGQTLQFLAALLDNDQTFEAINTSKLEMQLLTFNNGGLVEARGGSQLEIAADSLENSATVRVAGGSTGMLSDASVDNEGGLFEATGNSSFRFSDVTLKRGTISADDSSLFLAQDYNRLENVTVQGLLQGQPGSRTDLVGTIDNTGGEIQILSGGSAGMLSGTVIVGGTLSGEGLIDTTGGATLDGTGGMHWRDVSIRVDYGHDLDLVGTYTNDGRLLINDEEPASKHFGGAHLNAHVRLKGDVTINGGGIVAFVTEHANLINAHPDTPDAVLTLGPNQTLTTGAPEPDGPQIRGTVNPDLVNHGTVDAGSGGLIFIKSEKLTNRGTLKASTGGHLRLDNGSMLLDNVGGHITADSGGNVWVQATVVGGTLDGTGTIRVSNDPTLDATGGQTWNDVTVLVPSAGDLFLEGTFTNNAVLRLYDSDPFGSSPSRHHGNSYVHLRGPVTLNGTGAVRFASQYNNTIREAGGTSASLTIGPQQTVHTEGQNTSGRIEVPLTNHGVINADGGKIFLLGSSVTNLNRIASTENGDLNFSQNSTVVDNTGGVIEIAEGSRGYLTGTLRGGTLEGGGRFLFAGDPRIESAGGMTWNQTTVELRNGTDLFLHGTFENNGKLRIRDLDPADKHFGGAHLNARVQLDGPVTFNGSGQIAFASEHNNSINGVGGTGATLTIGPQQTFTTEPDGRGHVNVPVINHGVIEPNDGVIDLRGDSLINHNLVHAHDTGAFRFFGGTLNNAEGTLRLEPGAGHELRGTVIGGTLEGGGVIHVTGKFDATNGMSIDNVLRLGTVGRTLILEGELIEHNGEIQIQDPEAASQHFGGASLVSFLRIAGPVRLEGDGVISARTKYQNVIDDVNGTGGSLTLGPNQRIEVPTDTYLRGSLPLTLEGSIHVDGEASFQRFSLDVTAATSQISGSGKLELEQGRQDFGGLLSPGNSPGTLTLAGGFDMLPTARTLIEILVDEQEGTLHDRLSATQNMTLDGELLIELLGPPPSADEVLTILSSNKSVSGHFANAVPDASGVGRVSFAGGQFDVIYNAKSVELANFVPEPATAALLAAAGPLLLTRPRRRA